MIERFESTPPTEVIGEFALALARQTAGDWEPIGTAIAIASQLVLTAKHVVEPIWKPHHLWRPDKQTDSAIIAFQVLPGAVGSLWHAKHAYLSPHTDPVLLDVFPDSQSAVDHKWRKVLINFAPPHVGQTVLGFGYKGGHIQPSDDQRKSLCWHVDPRTTEGTVVRVHPSRRDRGLYDFPCFEMSARTEHGMSGGPIFDQEGRLRGLVCGQGYREDGAATWYATLLWPLLLLDEIRGRFEGEAERLFSFYELVKRRVVAATGLDALDIRELDGGRLAIGPRTE